jgi:2-oxoglutarate ferredoxin oxidoreductase subunit alpha
MMEKVELPEFKARSTEFNEDWMLTGKPSGRKSRFITSLDLEPSRMEKHNLHLQEKYDRMTQEEVRWEEFDTKDAEYLFVAYGSSARISQKAVQLAREKGIKAGLLRPITLFPYPSKRLKELAPQLKGILSVEMSMGQMVEDVKLAVECKVHVEHFGRVGGIVHSPEEVLRAMECNFLQ